MTFGDKLDREFLKGKSVCQADLCAENAQTIPYEFVCYY